VSMWREVLLEKMHSIEQWQARWLEGFSSTRALVFHEQGSTSYATLLSQVIVLAQQLKQQPQQQWILWTEQSGDFLLGFLALLISQKTIILPPNLTQQQLAQLQQQGARLLDHTALQCIDPTLNDADSQQHSTVSGSVNWPALSEQASIVFFTSGSTGEAKQVQRSLQQLLFELETLSNTFELPHDALYIATVSHQHIYGLLFKVLLPFYRGGAFYDQQLAYPEHILAAASRFPDQHSIVLVASPACLKRWPEGTSIQPIQHIFSSGGVLPESVHTAIDRPIIEILGSTETGGMAYRSATQQYWQPFADVEFAIHDMALSIKSRHASQAGWIATGDSADFYQSGFMLGERLDRIVKLEEKRISLDAIEQTLKQQAMFDEVHVLMVATVSGRQSLVCMCVLTKNMQQQLKKDGKKVIVQMIKQQLAGKIDRIALPRQWRFVSQLPCNSQAKLNKHQIRALFMSPQYLPIARVIAQQAQRVHLELEFMPEQVYFQGHFPDFPIYPGVAQIAMVDAFAQQYLGVSGGCGQMEQIKFMRLIRPHDVLQLEIEQQNNRVTFKLYGAESNVASGRLVYALADDSQVADHCA
jgi:acyl-coenzyme A synthetase/AMP-(fatty) acid ligase